MSGTTSASSSSYDVLILGGGPGGARAADILSKAGKRVCLISNDLGGECLNYGCIPTKTFVWTADLYEKIQTAEAVGIHLGGALQLNWDSLQKRKNEVIAKLKKNLKFRVEHNGTTICEGIGRVKDAHTVEIPQTGQRLTGEYLILATGSSPAGIPGFEISDQIVTNHGLLSLPALPKTLLVIGGGVIGVEFASLFAVFGTMVTIAEASDRLIPAEDTEVSVELSRIFTRRGIEIKTNTRMNPTDTASFEKTLLAVGRKPNISEDVAALGMTTHPHGIQTNDAMQTSIPSVYAIGDLAGKALLAYSAEREGEVAARNILGKPTGPIRYDVLCNTIFSSPEVASVGAREQDLKAKGISYKVGRASFSANAKALIVGNRDGFAKILIDTTSEKILGVHIIGEKASELIAEASLSMSMGATFKQFSQNLHSHPILGEVLKDACEAIA